MPSRPPRSQLLSGVSHALGALILFAGCTSTIDGHPHDPAYNVDIFLCSGAHDAATSCTHAATRAEIAALRTRLRDDKDVLAVQYLTERDTYRLGRYVLPEAQLLRPGDLPPEYWVDARDGAAQDTMSRYAAAAGVALTRPCARTALKCSVDLLRKAGIVH